MSFIPESILFPNHEDHHTLFPTSSPHDFLAVPDFMMRRSVSFSGMDRPEEFQPDDDGSDDGSQYQLGEKKRRLNLDQVKALEKSFDSGNKLEPERKVQLARALGLQPRQIAIWFQNRRARWKTKQLEKDYDVLKAKFEELKADNDALKSQNNNLQTQLMNLKSKTAINLNKDNEGSNWSNGSETSCDLNAINSTLCHPPKNIAGTSQTPAANDNCFGNVMFGGIEENPEFWPWPEQQNFH